MKMKSLILKICHTVKQVSSYFRNGFADVNKDERNVSGLSIYMWADDASFEFVMNQKMSKQFPYGMNPTLTNDDDVVRSNATFAAELSVGISTENTVVVSTS